jgi:hypothetical protein
VYWFRRPPYLRWAAAALLIIAAAWMDIRPQPTSRQPFAAVDLYPGIALDNTMIEWRSVPIGLLPPLDDPQGIVLHSVTAGEPLVPSILSATRIPTPEGWWTMEIHLPVGAVPGQAVQLILLPTGLEEDPRSVPGLVIVPPPQDQDPLAIEPEPGLVAVPSEWATLAAAAVAQSSVTVILGADSG